MNGRAIVDGKAIVDGRAIVDGGKRCNEIRDSISRETERKKADRSPHHK
jgi:hypothetical protein